MDSETNRISAKSPCVGLMSHMLKSRQETGTNTARIGYRFLSAISRQVGGCVMALSITELANNLKPIDKMQFGHIYHLQYSVVHVYVAQLEVPA